MGTDCGACDGEKEFILLTGCYDCRSVTVTARFNLDRTLPALPWAWLLWVVCPFYSLFAGPVPSTLPYPKTPSLCWPGPNPFAEPVPARHYTRNTGTVWDLGQAPDLMPFISSPMLLLSLCVGSKHLPHGQNCTLLPPPASAHPHCVLGD